MKQYKILAMESIENERKIEDVLDIDGKIYGNRLKRWQGS